MSKGASVDDPDHRPMLQVSSLRKSFAGATVLIDFDITIDAGEVHALVGENGSGKSTFIKLLSGFHTPDSGQMLVDGEVLEPGSALSSYRRGLRFVHQDLGLIDSISILDNLA